MKEIVELKSKLDLKLLLDIDSIRIKKIKILSSLVRELQLFIEVSDLSKYQDLQKFHSFIIDNLKEFSGTFNIKYFCRFNLENATRENIIRYLIEKYIIEKPALNNVFLSYDLKVFGNDIIISLFNDMQIEQASYCGLDQELRKKLLDMFNEEYKISYRLKEDNKEITANRIKLETEINKHYTSFIIDFELGKEVVIVGEIFTIKEKEIKTKDNKLKKIVSFYITDHERSSIVRKFYDADKDTGLKRGDVIEVKGTYTVDEKYTQEQYINPRFIKKVAEADNRIIDNAAIKRVELNLKTNMSEMCSNINSKSITTTLKEIGYKAFAVTDNGVAHAYPFVYKNAKEDIKVIFGIDAYVVDDSMDLVVAPKNIKIEDETYVIFDIETTGLDPYNDKIIEIGAVKVKNLNIVDRYSSFINPEMKLSDFTKSLTNISDEDVENAPKIEEVLPEFLDFIKDATLVAQNAKFDIGFITEKAKQMNIKTNFSYIDTINWAKLVLPEQKKYNLDALCKRFNIPNDNHHRAVNDAEVTTKIFIELLNRISAMNVETLVDINNKLKIDVKIAPTNKTTILVKNQKGLKKIYELISDSFINNFGKKTPRMLKSKLSQYRDDLLISSSAEMGFNNQGELVSMYIRGIDREEIEKASEYYDYFQVLPTDCYEKEILTGEVSSRSYIEDMNKYFYELSKKQNKLLVAVGNVMYLTKNESKAKKVLQVANENMYRDAKYNTNAHFRTTEEMLKEFNYMGEEISYEIVVLNTNKIADSIEAVRPIPKGFYPPQIEGSVEEVKRLTYDKALELYGENPPKLIKDRIEKELNSIINNGFAVLYLIAQKLVHKSVESGYLVGSRGSVGSSLVAYLMGITEVNSLPPHYRCPNSKCKNIEIIEAEGSGVDLEEKDCPKCSSKYIRDGHAIPFEVFMGFEGDKVPDIDLNFSGEFQSEIHKYTEELFGKENVFRAGTISTTAENNAIGYVKKYFEELNKEEIKQNIDETYTKEEANHLKEEFLKKIFSKNSAEIIRLAGLIDGVRKTTGQHPGGMVVVPSDMSIYDFCPIQKPANDENSKSTTTHFDYHVMDEQLVKLDILGHDDPTTLKILEDLTGLSPYDIPLTDDKVLSLFSSTKALGVEPSDIGTDLGTNGIPEFGTGFVKEMLKDTLPKTFTELVRISGLSHGTDVWLNNAQEYINQGIATLNDVITVRDDIMNYLILQGMDKSLSFKIMEFIRKGQPHKNKEKWEEYKALMKEKGIKSWYIDSCEKIKYMFPKGHAVAYVMMAIRIAYFKVYYPIEFYTAYLNRKISHFSLSKMFLPVAKLKNRLNELNMKSSKSVADKQEIALLEILIEMDYRGVKLSKVDLYSSKAQSFYIENGKIRIPLVAVDQLGETIANKIEEERGNRMFSSIEDLKKRTGTNTAIINQLIKYQVLVDLEETDQQKLF